MPAWDGDECDRIGRTAGSTWSRFVFACSERAVVVSPTFAGSSGSSWSGVTAFKACLVLERPVFRAPLRDRRAGSRDAASEASRFDFVESRVRPIAAEGENRPVTFGTRAVSQFLRGVQIVTRLGRGVCSSTDGSPRDRSVLTAVSVAHKGAPPTPAPLPRRTAGAQVAGIPDVAARAPQAHPWAPTGSSTIRSCRCRFPCRTAQIPR